MPWMRSTRLSYVPLVNLSCTHRSGCAGQQVRPHGRDGSCPVKRECPSERGEPVPDRPDTRAVRALRTRTAAPTARPASDVVPRVRPYPSPRSPRPRDPRRWARSSRHGASRTQPAAEYPGPQRWAGSVGALSLGRGLDNRRYAGRVDRERMGRARKAHRAGAEPAMPQGRGAHPRTARIALPGRPLVDHARPDDRPAASRSDDAASITRSTEIRSTRQRSG